MLMRKMELFRRKSGIVHCKVFISSIISALNFPFPHCFNDEDLCLAAMVHPKFKLSWIKEDERTAMLDKVNLSFETFYTDSTPRFKTSFSSFKSYFIHFQILHSFSSCRK
jgi:hypothetical protein